MRDYGGTMREIYSNFRILSAKKRKLFTSIIIVFLVIEAIAIFPLKYEISLSSALLIYVYLSMGLLLHAAYGKNSRIVFLIIFLSNAIGIILRAWVEWGEVTMMQNLNISNISFTYIPLCVMITVGYLLTDLFFGKLTKDKEEEF